MAPNCRGSKLPVLRVAHAVAAIGVEGSQIHWPRFLCKAGLGRHASASPNRLIGQLVGECCRGPQGEGQGW